jgi:L-ribulokinase
MADKFVVGVDFGTLSARALVARVSDGVEVGVGVLDYAHGVLDDVLPATGERLPAGWALQVPADYLAALRHSVTAALAAAHVSAEDVIGIGVDFTASTFIPTLADSTPLCETPAFAAEKHAYAKLWKHHGAQAQADRITDLARRRGDAWLARYGGVVSSEWQFPKLLQVLQEAPDVYDATWRFVEAGDWIVWRLSGAYVRNACAVGYKGFFQDGHQPGRDFLEALDPAFGDLVEQKLAGPVGDLGSRAGGLTEDAARWLGLPAGIAVAVANVDAHVAAPAARAVEPGRLVAIMGTSTCHIVNAPDLHVAPGMGGVVHGGIVTGQWGYEAGQSGVGDVFGWFVDNAVPPDYHAEAARRGVSIHGLLTELASRQEVGEHGLLCLDWLSGNRSVLVNHELSGLILGLTLATKPEDVYRALIEATAFGARVIVDNFVQSGVDVREFIVSGGLKKNHLLMQIYSDVLKMPLSVATSEQGPALGSAIHAAVAAGAYPDVPAAADAMGARASAVWQPIPANSEQYEALYREYVTLHDYFGRGANEVMLRLAARRRKVRASVASEPGAGPGQ